jgi:hypothetical protein
LARSLKDNSDHSSRNRQDSLFPVVNLRR